MTGSVWHDRGLQRTNPVYFIEQAARDLEAHYYQDFSAAARALARVVEALSQEGTALPSFEITDLKHRGYLPTHFQPAPAAARPGVLGLLVETGTELGYVLPLDARESPSGWQIDDTLPFREEAVLSALVRLVQASGLPTAGVLPERLAFSFKNPLDYRAKGNSMTVAAMLAVIDALDGRRSNLLHCACAVVEPAEGGRLRPVRHIGPKLQAVCREYQGGTLLVCAPGCPQAAAFRHHFGTVWEVDGLVSLARALHESGLLAAVMRKAPLRPEEVQRVHDRLRWLVRTAHNYEQASDLGKRLGDLTTAGATAEAVPATLANGIASLTAESWRHQGRFREANETGRRMYDEVQARGEFTCYDERADTAVEYAAALFDAHCFADLPPLLRPWVQQIDREPLHLRPETRVKIFNTLGRALVVLGENGWDELFRRSLALQERLSPGDVPRTKSYLIHGLLRCGLVEQARAELDALNPLPGTHDFASRVLRFLRADLARRTGARWVDDDMERLAVGQMRPGHPSALYFQATARQPGQEDAARRFRVAAEFLRADGHNHPGNITSLFAALLELAATAADGDRSAWPRAAEAVRAFLNAPEAATLRTYYAPALAGLTAEPDPEAAERFLLLVPYF